MTISEKTASQECGTGTAGVCAVKKMQNVSVNPKMSNVT